MRIAVLGSGTMAPGIVAAFASAGHEVTVWGRRGERSEDTAQRARELARGLADEDLLPAGGTAEARIDVARSLAALAQAELVVEAVAEDPGIKRELFARLEDVVGPETVIASNTSGLLITDLAAELRHPERVVAMHFWNPAHLMPLVEICGGQRTAPEIVTRTIRVATDIGKRPVRLQREILGFLGVRMQQAVVREAIALLESGVAVADDIDLAVRMSFGVRFPAVGPLESADLTGLDVIEAIHEYLLPDLDRSTEPQPALRERVRRGALGIKASGGFHDWTSKDPQECVRRRDEELVRRLHLLREQEVTSA